MTKKTAAPKPLPIRHYVRVMILIAVIVLIADLIISITSIIIVRQQSTRYLKDTAALYINRINHDFAYMNHYMGWTLANDETLNTMNAYRINSIEFLKSNENLHKKFTELQKNYGQEYNFFYYLKNQSYFLNCAPISVNYPDYLELKQQIISIIDDKEVYEKFYSKWTPILVNGKYYVINIVPYYNRYLIGLISADNLIRPLREINLGESGYASLVDDQGTVLSSPVSNSGKAVQGEGRFSLLQQPRTTISSEFLNTTFSADMVIKFGAFEKIMIAQLLIVLLFFMVISSLSIIMIFLNRRVLGPIQSFSENLARINEESQPADYKGSKIIELEQANSQFKDLVQQIKTFKIAMYEQELEKQQIQLDYMKQQIKPHFFLNCLTSIYSMAQIQMYQEIEDMAMTTSKYFRYLFQNGENFVPLESEIEHVQMYLEIQKQRYRDAFSYQVELPEEARNVKIPPLVLQTFIENSVKYAISRENEMQITLTVQRCLLEEQITGTRIELSDNGPGFPPEVLEKLQGGLPLDQTKGTHIGIMNTLKRLEYLYYNLAGVTFTNIPGSGACVTLYLPDLPEPAAERKLDL
ncbi:MULTISPECIES: histidine kinase [unclassified Paenibacillus]|uniref:sensor histidine kinase n=1 Tax=unclassified Paenibacillus TaxID=185978 RepID=UPI002404F8EB|nr:MULTISPECIES: histidine kinase [unclassified Paenibacillus]MDF9840627.1 two-component system sensor histidine kinase YesM [Paenibacillus sp. PastF-2]MDF9847209.1 two-component system sensor histidine kinase YesM [Paenibacillus sp. PastM-2]MDF9853781.1 two-component system sensor histidine kinase YesM [Paenibacillus sp. PastF-1]MDH6478733.1 two-component system sensor histidine kinase YesM [Paenibacillus sp. PastH-2]MDH6506465.1 two-component system sensor histidine kinase YesM [Paenibacillu